MVFDSEEAVVLMVPSTMYDQPLPDETFRHEVEMALILFSDLFGGATVITGHGGWLSDGQLITEEVGIVFSFAKNLDYDQVLEVYRYAVRMKHRLNQEAVFVIVSGRSRIL